MQIDNQFQVPVPIEEAWLVLTDIERIAPCMPGATLDEVVDENTYKGSVAIRLGPVALSFNGQATFKEIDPQQHRAVVHAQGMDKNGRGNVQADVQFTLQPEGGATLVRVATDLKLSGTVAQYGRGAGMINDVATHWVKSFSECLSNQLSESAVSSTEQVVQPKAAANKPMPVLTVGFKVIWAALLRGIRRVFRP